jgi:hypothetical protein
MQFEIRHASAGVDQLAFGTIVGEQQRAERVARGSVQTDEL